MADDVVRLRSRGGCANAMKLWQPPPWLEEWRSIELPPVPRSKIIQLIGHLAGLLQAAEPEAIAVLLQPLGELFEAPKPEAMPHYVEILGELTAETLELAVQRCMRELRFYPAPAEILERADEYHRLCNARTRLETALWRIDLETRRRA